MAINLDQKIKFVRGNSFAREYEIQNVSLEYINSIRIICKELNICETLYADENGIFKFYLSSIQTSNMPDIHTTYSLEVVFVDNSVQTVIYQEQFIILPQESSDCL